MFTLRTKGVTSIFSHSEQLNTFWKKWQTSHENAEFVAAIRALQDVEPRLLVTFFPLLLDQLFAVLTNRAEAAAREAAWTVIYILEWCARQFFLGILRKFLTCPSPAASLRRYRRRRVGTRCWCRTWSTSWS